MNITKEKVFKVLLIILFLLVLWYSGAVWVYILISLVLALLLSPLNQFIRKLLFKKFGIRRTIAAVGTLAILIGIMVLIANIFVPVITKEVKILSTVKMDAFYDVLEPEIKSFKRIFYKANTSEYADKSEKEIIQNLLLGKKNLDRVPNFFSGLASGIGDTLIAIFSVLFITFFLLKDDDLFNNFVHALSSDNQSKKVNSVLYKVKTTLSRYFIGIAIQVTLITFLVSSGLSILGFENALVIGLFAGLMNVIPYVGPIIGLAFGLLIGISTNIDLTSVQSFWSVFGKIVFVFGFTQIFDNFITQPIVFSKSINAHPLEIFLVILIAGSIGGVPGMIIAVPLYSVLRIIAKEYYGDSKFIQFMTQKMDE